MKIGKEKLLVVAAVVWGLAGINILRIGITALVESFKHTKILFFLLMLLGGGAVFFGFLMMFLRVVKRNTNRILSYPKKKSIFAFLDAKGYLLMAFMMGLGIVLRSSGLLPNAFFAVFYTGLGSALTLAGVFFIRNFLRTRTKSAKDGS